jgi:hypothetical protein
MPDHDAELIALALDDFRGAEAVAPLDPEGVAAVRATVRRRRRVKLTTFSVAGALLVAVPIAAFAAHPRGNNPPPEVLDSAKRATTRDALFSREELAAARVPIPAGAAWQGCPARVTADGPGDKLPTVFLGDAIHPNLDADPALETAVIVICRLRDATVTQVVGFDIDAKGAPVSLGALVKPQRPHDIRNLRHRDGGGFAVTVAFSVGDALDDAEPQTREFAWDGRTFRQVAGPTAFPERAMGNLSVTSGPLTLNPPVFGKRHGMIPVTVTNRASSAAPFVRISLAMSGLTIVGTDEANTVRLPGLQPGETRTFELAVVLGSQADGNRATVEVGAHSYIHDSAPEDNQVVVAIHRL